MRALVVLAATALAPAALASPPRWQALPAMPAPDTTAHVEVEGARIYVAIFGRGAPVILLHGGMGNGDHWAHQVPALAATMQVIVIDSRGQGRSTRTSAAPTHAALARDVVAVMDHLQVAQAAVVGWSDGGEIALALAVRHPERVAKLAVFGARFAASAAPSRKPTSTFRRYHAKCRADYARLSPTPKRYAATVRWLSSLWRASLDVTSRQLAAIAAPSLVLHGEHDELVPQAHADELARLIPNARLEILADTSHFAHWQDPTHFNKLLVDFLAPAPAKVP